MQQAMAIINILKKFFFVLALSACHVPEQPFLYRENYVAVPNGVKYFSDSLQLSTGPLGYTAYLPTLGLAEGVILFFQDAKPDSSRLLDEMKCVLPAVKKNLAVIFLSTGNPVDFLFEQSELQKLDTLVHKSLEDNNLSKAKLLFAGLSLSGTRAARYAIFCENNRSAFGIHPKALVLCDSPLDLIRFYQEHAAAYTLNFNQQAYATAAMVIPYLNKKLRSPAQNLQAYINYSPFCQADTLHKNAQSLSKIYIRAYHKPDVNWWLKFRRKDYYAMNSVDLAGFVRQLMLVGNENASLITILEESDGEENSPHSWKIVNNEALINWFVNIKP